MEVANLLTNQTEVFGTYPQFLSDCDKGLLPDYSFVEPNYSDHDSDDGEEVASDQHPDHDVQAGEALIAEVYTHIKNGPNWANTALLVVYDEHGAIFDHVPPPACPKDTFQSTQVDPGTGLPFQFDRLGVRVPAILISPWIPKGTVVNRVFDHASIPATITKFFLGSYPHVSLREANADVFIEPNNGQGNLANNLLSLDAVRDDCPDFQMSS
jgi:phospholipase C